jgi:predicted Zn-dependent peptidase
MFEDLVRTKTLSNGVRVISEQVGYVDSISVGIWVKVGSRDEQKQYQGISHFIEHMMFKGTERRDAKTIADEIESRGGNLNAFTDKEYTCYYAKALAEHADIVVDVLSDMILHSKHDPEELAREKNVVLEEIKRYKDNPDDTVHDLFAQTIWAGHPLGRSVIGMDKTVRGLEREHLMEYIQNNYTPDRIVLSVAGNVEFDKVVELAETHLGELRGRSNRKYGKNPQYTRKNKLQRKSTEQVHFCLGCQGFRETDETRYPLVILDTVLGGNMSSRLFQEIREKRGLAYAIGSYSVSYGDGGLFTVFGGTSPDTFDQVVELTRLELNKVRKEGLTEQEITKAKTQIKGAMTLGMENMSSRMMRMGKSMLYYDRFVSLNEILGKIQAVTSKDIIMTAENLFNEENMTLAAIGPFKSI